MKYLYQNKYWQLNKEYNIDKLLYLMIDRPKLLSEYGTFIWRNNKNKPHRDYDLPAIKFFDNEMIWYVNDNRHREKPKPAIIDCNGNKVFYKNGIQI